MRSPCGATAFEVIIIGGSYSGLQAALTLGRSLRKTLVVDGGEPCNRFAPHSHNFLTHDGAKPQEIAKQGKHQIVDAYSDYVSFYDGLATAACKKDDGSFEITTDAGKVFTAQKVILATGVKDKIPPLDGFADCWGKTIIHCPFCHGYELRDRPVAFWAPNQVVLVKLLPLICNLTGKNHPIWVLCSTSLKDEQLAQVKAARNVEVVAVGDDCKLKQIHHDGNGQLTGVELENRRTISVGVMYAHVPWELPDVVQQFGCEMNEMGLVKVDPMQKTSVDGLLACGDCTTPFRTLTIAVAQGNMAGAVTAMELANKEFMS